MLINRPRYLNFNPTDSFQLYADSLIGRLLNLAPSDSVGHASIEKLGNKSGAMYACRIEIISAVERFNAFIESTNPKAALEEARRRIMRQLSKWHQTRSLMTRCFEI